MTKSNGGVELFQSKAKAMGFNIDEVEATFLVSAYEGMFEDWMKVCLDAPIPGKSAEGRRYWLPSPSENPYNSFITRCELRPSRTGILSGYTVGLKDNIAVAGIPMTLGSRLLQDYIPSRDALVVEQLLASGATIIGKMNMDGFSMASMGVGTGTGDFQRCLNPRNPEYLSGGSSSGSATAVAAGEVDIAIGGDQGGSIRIPAAWCGIVGLKATHGLIPDEGVIGVEPKLDHIGPLGRTVPDVAKALRALTTGERPTANGPDTLGGEFRMDFQMKGKRIGLLSEGLQCPEQEKEVETAIYRAVDVLRKLGADVVDVSVPEHVKASSAATLLQYYGMHALVDTGLYNGLSSFDLYHPDFVEYFNNIVRNRLDEVPLRAKMASIIQQMAPWRHEAYVRALIARDHYRSAFDKVFASFDCLVMPTVPFTAPKFDNPATREEALRRTILRDHVRGMTYNTAPYNVTGHPALTVPCGLNHNGLPIGLMLVGPYYSDVNLLNIGYQYERSAQWH